MNNKKVLNHELNINELNDTQKIWLALLELNGRHAYVLLEKYDINLKNINATFEKHTKKYFGDNTNTIK
jgi:hypothetical protein